MALVLLRNCASRLRLGAIPRKGITTSHILKRCLQVTKEHQGQWQMRAENIRGQAECACNLVVTAGGAYEGRERHGGRRMVIPPA